MAVLPLYLFNLKAIKNSKDYKTWKVTKCLSLVDNYAFGPGWYRLYSPWVNKCTAWRTAYLLKTQTKIIELIYLYYVEVTGHLTDYECANHGIQKSLECNTFFHLLKIYQ